MSAVGSTVQKVSEAPAANAVTHSVSAKEKNADVDRKVSELGFVSWMGATD